MADAPSTEVERLSPDEAFLLFADETRVDVVRVLGDAWVDEWPGALGYAEVMDRVGADDSGRFNYHLDKLIGHFVDDRENGYKLNFRGLLVYRAIVAGTFTEDVEVAPFELDAACHDCGAPLRARQPADGEMLVVACSDADCGCRYASAYLPPRGFHGRDRDEFLRALDRRTRHQASLFDDGVCPWCAGTAAGEVGRRADDSWGNHTLEYDLTYACDQCGGFLRTAVGRVLTFHPEVVTVYADRGVDLGATPAWELEFAVTDRATELLADDPIRLAVTVGPDDAHRAIVAADGSVESVDHIDSISANAP